MTNRIDDNELKNVSGGYEARNYVDGCEYEITEIPVNPNDVKVGEYYGYEYELIMELVYITDIRDVLFEGNMYKRCSARIDSTSVKDYMVEIDIMGLNCEQLYMVHKK